MRKGSCGWIVAALALALAPSLAWSQTQPFEQPLAAGPAEQAQPFTLPLLGAVGSQSATFISVLALQPNIAALPTAATYVVNVDGSADVTVPAFGMAPAPVGTPPVAQVFQPVAVANGRTVIQINHIPAISAGSPQSWVLKIQTAGGAPATCFYGVAAHTQPNSQVPKFSVIVGPTFYSDNDCGMPPALGAAAANFGKASLNAPRLRTVTVFNSGTGNLTLGAASLTANPTGFYSIAAPASGTVIAPNGHQDIVVTYTATAPPAPPVPPHTATLSVPSMAGPPTATVAITGEAVFRELVLLIDASNSMNWDNAGTPLASCPVATTQAPTFGTDSRIRKVRTALHTFDSKLIEYGDKQTHLAIVQFPGADLVCGSTHADAVASAPSTWQNVVRARSLFDSVLTPALAQIDAATDDGYYHSTPMKAGLQEALNQFTAVTGQYRAIILLSDGAQNVPPPPVSAADLLPDVLAKPARIYAIGLGALGAGSVDHTLLTNLATPTGGAFFDATTGSGSDLITYYAKIFTNFMELATAVDPEASVVPGGKNVHKVLVTEYDHRITFSIAWNTPRMGLLGFELVTPDGRRLGPGAPGVRFYESDTHKMFGLDLASNARGMVGEWQMEVSCPVPTRRAAAAPAPETYHYDVVTRSDLEMAVTFDKATYHTGDRIVVTAYLSEEGRAMTGRKVRLQTHRPDEGIGNWFAAHPAAYAQIHESVAPIFKDSIERIAPVFEKYYYLTKIQGIPVPPIKPVAGGVDLHDDGLDGDLRAGDGLYTAVLTGMLTKPGSYRFAIEADGLTSHQNKFRREAEVQHFVTPRIEIDPKFTKVLIERVEGGEGRLKRFRAVVKPQDRLGNLLGPGFDGSVVIESAGARAISKGVEEDLNGGYFRVFEYDARMSAPVVKAAVHGETLPEEILSGDVSGVGPGGSGSGGSNSAVTFLLILCLLLALALVVVLLRPKP
jgi:hypothetical protein